MTLAVLCPGQGAQHPAMLGVALAHAEGRRAIDEASVALGADLRDALDPGRMFENAVAQPLVCVAQLAQWRVLRDAAAAARALRRLQRRRARLHGAAGRRRRGTLAALARDRALAMDAAAVVHPGGVIALRGLCAP
jgi:[acyl-carrier-protein] S-malonyltransferase